MEEIQVGKTYKLSLVRLMRPTDLMKNMVNVFNNTVLYNLN